MKCPRVSCRAPMIALGHGGFACSVFECGATVYLTDMAAGDGLSASSKPDADVGRSRDGRRSYDRKLNATPERKAKKHQEYLAAKAAAMAVGQVA